MIDAVLERFSYTPEETLGVLKLGEVEVYTIERPWLDNRRGLSCIPEGEYTIELGYFNRGGYECIDVLGVPNRDLIKIHVANRSRELQGCIAPGIGLGFLRNERAVLRSRDALERLLACFLDSGCGRLRIHFRNRYGVPSDFPVCL